MRKGQSKKRKITPDLWANFERSLREGMIAAVRGRSLDDNPYLPGHQRAGWECGFCQQALIEGRPE